MDKRKNNGGARANAGRKTIQDELKGFNLALPHVEDAFRVISEIVLDDKKRPADRIAGAKIIIEYACGKPKETIDNNLKLSDFNIADIVRFKK